jgi:hypothetical protein
VPSYPLKFRSKANRRETKGFVIQHRHAKPTVISRLFGMGRNTSQRKSPTRLDRTFSICRLCLLLIAVVGAVQGFSVHPACTSQSPRKYSSSGLHENILSRFTDPKIEDPGIPLTEAGIVQIVAPTFQLFWLRFNQSPFPSWATPIYDYTFTPGGAVLAPTLIHGAGLACCWLLGCLAARAFEKESYEGDVSQVILSTAKAGAFATGLLILATQLDLVQDLGGFVQFGDDPVSDLRIYRALVEVINDVFFEAVTLITWRLVRSKIA